MLPIYSSKLKGTLEKAGVIGIQYLPIRILNPDGNAVGNFYIANILNLVAAFNLDNSIFNRFHSDFPNPNVRGKISGAERFVLSNELIVTASPTVDVIPDCPA